MIVEINGTFRCGNINENGECEIDLCPVDADTQKCCLFCEHIHKCPIDHICQDMQTQISVSLPFKRTKFIE